MTDDGPVPEDQRDPAPAPSTVPEGLELRHLRAFIAVAEELNFGRAAARLFVSQSSLSRLIAALERMLGCVLVHRTTHHVALTLAGQALLEQAPAILRDLEQLVMRTRSIGGELAARIARLGEPFATLTYADTEALRDAAERHYAQLPIAAGIEFRPVNARGVPALVATPPEATARWVLLLHGGAYVNGSAYGFRSMASALAEVTRGEVITPDYRLAPEYTYPAAVEDAESAFAWLLDRGVAPDDVLLVGDTSGAGLALCMLLRAKAAASPLPGRCVFFTPYVDIGTAAPERLPAEPANCATRAGAAFGVARYLGGHPVTDPVLNPLDCDLAGLPPMLIQAAAGDEGLPDAERLARHARACGVDARLEVYPVAAQSFQLYWSFLPQAADALRQVATFASP
jgi:monoterpene epsilon-lactone hydrolase